MSGCYHGIIETLQDTVLCVRLLVGVLDSAALEIFPAKDGLPLTTLTYANGAGPTDRQHLVDADTGNVAFTRTVRFTSINFSPFAILATSHDIFTRSGGQLPANGGRGHVLRKP
jgi:hypothetical protein